MNLTFPVWAKNQYNGVQSNHSTDSWHLWLARERTQGRKMMVRGTAHRFGKRAAEVTLGLQPRQASMLTPVAFHLQWPQPPSRCLNCYYRVQNLSAINVISFPTCTKRILIQNCEGTSHMADVSACMPRHWGYSWKNLVSFHKNQTVMHCYIRHHFSCYGTKPGHQTSLCSKTTIISHVSGKEVIWRWGKKQSKMIHTYQNLFCRDIAVMQQSKTSLYKVPGFPSWRNPVPKRGEQCLLTLLYSFSQGRKIVRRVQFWWKPMLQERWECTKGSLLGQQSVVGRAVIGVPAGLAVKHNHYVAEGDFTSPWTAQLSSPPGPPASSGGAGWSTALNHCRGKAALKVTGPGGRMRRGIGFITIQYFSPLKIKCHFRENKRGLTGGSQPMHSQFNLQGWVDKRFKYSNWVVVV